MPKSALRISGGRFLEPRRRFLEPSFGGPTRTNVGPQNRPLLVPHLVPFSTPQIWLVLENTSSNLGAILLFRQGREVNLGPRTNARWTCSRGVFGMGGKGINSLVNHVFWEVCFQNLGAKKKVSWICVLQWGVHYKPNQRNCKVFLPCGCDLVVF